MQERTLVLIKPHILTERLSCYAARRSYLVVTDIIGHYLAVQLRLVPPINVFKFSKDMLEEFYREHLAKPWFPELARDMTQGDTVAMIWSGRNAIRRVRRVNGATNPAQALPGTLRHKYGDRSNLSNNAVHGSESLVDAKREIGIIFGKRIRNFHGLHI